MGLFSRPKDRWLMTGNGFVNLKDALCVRTTFAALKIEIVFASHVEQLDCEDEGAYIADLDAISGIIRD